MDLSSPISSVIPSAHGPVLAALARAGTPLSGRQVASLVEGIVSRSRVNAILGDLAAAGLVLSEPAPPSVLYRLNRDHVAAPCIEGLADLRQTLLDRVRAEVTVWPRAAVAVWMFGSAARGGGSAASDIDLLVVRPDRLLEEDAGWRPQVARLAERVRLWSGNACEVLEFSRSELAGGSVSPRLVADLRRDAVVIAGEAPASLLGSSSRMTANAARRPGRRPHGSCADFDPKD